MCYLHGHLMSVLIFSILPWSVWGTSRLPEPPLPAPLLRTHPHLFPKGIATSSLMLIVGFASLWAWGSSVLVYMCSGGDNKDSCLDPSFLTSCHLDEHTLPMYKGTLI